MSHKIRLTVTSFIGLFIILIFSSTNASADYIVDYDGLADLSVFRPSTGKWHTFATESNSFLTTPWGLPTDVLAPADYDGDGLTDITVWRPESGVWYVRRSRTQDFIAIQWGTVTPVMFGAVPDIPVPADYDGDGQADFAVWRPVDGIWYVLTSTQGFNPLYASYFQFGKLGDIPVPADYDGDGKTDLQFFARRKTAGIFFKANRKV